MPNNVDFSNIKNIKTLEVNPKGWVENLVVEYGIGEDMKIYGAESYFWRVKGTQHTFIIPIARMDFLSSGNYKKHFNEALETFREDYLSWKKEGFIYRWAKDYERQFSKFIVV